MLDTSSSTSTMAAWLPADLPLSLHYKSREGGVIAKHCARRYTLLVQLLLILVGFWVGIRIGTSHLSGNIAAPFNPSPSRYTSLPTVSLAPDDTIADVDAAAAPVADPNANDNATANDPDTAAPARPPTLAAALGEGDPPSLMDLTAVKIVMQKHGEPDLHWFHRLFNMYCGFQIEGIQLQSLLSPTQNTFLPDCIDRIRVLLKEHYKTVATLTTTEHMPKFEHFVDDTALYVFNHPINRFQKLRSPSILTTLAMMTLQRDITVVTIAFTNDCLAPRINDPVLVWEDFNTFPTDINEMTPSLDANLPENAVDNGTRKPPPAVNQAVDPDTPIQLRTLNTGTTISRVRMNIIGTTPARPAAGPPANPVPVAAPESTTGLEALLPHTIPLILQQLPPAQRRTFMAAKRCISR